MAPLDHRRCGHCNGSLPSDYDECPYCNKRLEKYGAIGKAIDGVLPKEYPVTKILLAVVAALYVLIGLLAGDTALVAPSLYTSIRFGANFIPYILDGEVWRLVTSAFLHGDILHIGFNAYALWIIGRHVERFFGRGRYLFAIIITGVGAMIISAGWGFLAPIVHSMLPIPFFFTKTVAVSSLGMSGALTGLLGMGFAAGKRTKTDAGAMLSKLMLRWIIFIAIFGLLVPSVDNAAHVGGFLLGLPLGYLLPRRDAASPAVGWAVSISAGVLALGVVACFAVHFATLPDYNDDESAYSTGIFGYVIRPGDTSALNHPHQRCTESLKDIETSRDAGGDVSQEILNETHERCSRARYIYPLESFLWSNEAIAAHYAGDDDEACRRAQIAGTMERFSGQPSRARLQHIEVIIHQTCR